MRRGESLLLTIGIPVILLVFFSEVHLLPTGTAHPVTFLAPGILALAVMGTALVNLSIATGFERGYGVLKRLGATPLGRPSLLGAKIVAILVVEVIQAAVLVPVALGLGWHPTVGRGGPGRRRRGAGHGRVRGHRPVAGRGAARRGQPGRGQRAVAAASSRERDAGTAVQIAGRAPGRRQGAARRRARRRAAPQPWAWDCRCRDGPGSCSWCGRSPLPSPPRPRSGGNEPGPVRGRAPHRRDRRRGQRDRRRRGDEPRTWVGPSPTPTPSSSAVGSAA